MRSAQVQGLRLRGVVMAERIAECIYAAGGEPLVLYRADADDVTTRLASFDAVVLPGGRDVDPARYTDQPRHERTDEPDPLQDAADIAVARAVVATRTPTLAICRGFQILNVALGGTLIQHLEPGVIDHSNNELHEVRLTPESQVARVMGSTAVEVSSYHHQAVGQVGEGLIVVGRASDGCVEALEHVDAPLIAVQWHPEDNAAQAPEQQALFDALIASVNATGHQQKIGVGT